MSTKRQRWPFPLLDTLPKPKGPFTDAEAMVLLAFYRQNPAHLPCPRCYHTHGPDTVEVLSFIEPEIDAGGWATVTQPVGGYACAVYCHTCGSAIGLLAGESN